MTVVGLVEELQLDLCRWWWRRWRRRAGVKSREIVTAVVVVVARPFVPCATLEQLSPRNWPTGATIVVLLPVSRQSHDPLGHSCGICLLFFVSFFLSDVRRAGGIWRRANLVKRWELGQQGLLEQ
jgi:hypothetical protein